MSNIRITYQTHDGIVPVTIEIAPSEYYDPLDSNAVSFELDGVQRYTAPHEYVPVHPDNLKLLIIIEPQTNGQRELRVQYLDGLRSHCMHSIWPDGTEELIHSTDITPETYHIIRTEKDRNGLWSVVMNTYGHSSDDFPLVSRLGRYNGQSLRDYWRSVRR